MVLPANTLRSASVLPPIVWLPPDMAKPLAPLASAVLPSVPEYTPATVLPVLFQRRTPSQLKPVTISERSVLPLLPAMKFKPVTWTPAAPLPSKRTTGR